TAHEVGAALTGQPERSSYEIVRDYWKQQGGAKNFELFWRTALHNGVVAGTAAPVRHVALKRDLHSGFASGKEQEKKQPGFANGTGFNAYALRTSDAPWHGSGVEIRKTSDQYPLACTQFHQLMEGRQLVRVGTLDAYHKNPNFVREMAEEEASSQSLYPGFKYEGYAWGMAIDINSCIGCNACVVACEAENNGPIVGKSEVLRGREMHWIRID